MSSGKGQASARERLLEAANELFYEEGVHTVGIDRVLARAGVAKASLYSTFGSKDELVREYLHRRALLRRQQVAQEIAQHQEDPRAQILSVFDVLEEIARQSNFRGCAFINACAERVEGRRGPGHEVALEQREWMCDLFASLGRDLGVADPVKTARQLKVLYDGAIIGAAIASNPELARDARAMAESLLDREIPSKPARPSPKPAAALTPKKTSKRTRSTRD
jgi:AcrR family transcriptional regulator